MRMKKLILWALILVLALSSIPALAEETPVFTADEQAYDAYLDISAVYNDGVKYLQEMQAIWTQINELDSLKDATADWFYLNYVCRVDIGTDIKRIGRFSKMAQVLYGYYPEDLDAAMDELYNFMAEAKDAAASERLDLIWVCLTYSQVAHIIQTKDELQAELDAAKQSIRDLMTIDQEYPFLEDLQAYYKAAVYLVNYICEFNDSYFGITGKLESFEKGYTSFEVDFEFIFDTSDAYTAVREYCSDEIEQKRQATYDQAAKLEAAGKYQEAIQLYWEYGTYSSAQERILACHSAKAENEKEPQYQNALALESSGDYEAAIQIYEELNGYKDSSDRITTCKNAIVEADYQKALSLEKQGKHHQASSAFKSLGNYKDSKDRAKQSMINAFEGIWVWLDAQSLSQEIWLSSNPYDKYIIDFDSMTITLDFNSGKTQFRVTRDFELINGTTIKYNDVRADGTDYRYLHLGEDEGYLVMTFTERNHEDVLLNEKPAMRKIGQKSDYKAEPIPEATPDPAIILNEYTDKASVKNVQSALNKAGYACGTPDGIAGKKTKAAVTQYQTDKGLNITGTITHETLISLGLAK